MSTIIMFVYVVVLTDHNIKSDQLVTNVWPWIWNIYYQDLINSEKNYIRRVEKVSRGGSWVLIFTNKSLLILFIKNMMERKYLFLFTNFNSYPNRFIKIEQWWTPYEFHFSLTKLKLLAKSQNNRYLNLSF